MTDSLKDFWFSFKQHNRILIIYRDVKYGILNLIKWLPIIWRDRDWDEFYLLKMLSFKLDNMSKLHSKYGNTEDSEVTTKSLRVASLLAERIAEEDYTEEAFGDKKYLMDKDKMEFVDTDKKGVKEIVFTGLTDEKREEMLRLYKLEDELLERDIEILFNLMKKDLRSWWD